MCQDVCIEVNEIVENITIEFRNTVENISVEVRDFSVLNIISQDENNSLTIGNDGLLFVPEINTDEFVKSVNSILPDENGNVDIAILESVDLDKSENYTINYNLSDGSVIPLELSQSHRHIQTSNSDEWIITHNLGYRPSVTIIDLDGDVVNADITYNTNNQITLTFAQPIKGEAYLN